MALSVAKPTKQPTIVVGKPFKMSTPLQGSSYNPQQTAPSTVLQRPATVQQLQPTYNPQRTANPQPAAQVMPSAAQIQATAAQAAEVARQAAVIEAARQREVLRVQVQGQVDTKVAANKEAFQLKVANPVWNGKIQLGKPQKLPKIVLPAQSEYDKAYADAYNKAMQDVSGKTKIGKQNVAQKLWDKVSFGSDRRQSAAREYAAAQAQKVVDKTTKTYQSNLDTFLKNQAKKKAGVEGAKYLTQSQWEKAVSDYTAWENSEIQKLENQRAGANAQIDAYGKASSAPLTSAAAKGASMFNRNVIHGAPGNILGNVWQYTLGQGSEHAPSVVTAPGRAVNWLGNLNTKDRTIYQEGGKTTNRATSGKNAWESTYNQRSVNLKPWTDKKFTQAEKEKMFGKEADKKAAEWAKLDGKKIGWTGTYNDPKVKSDPKLKDRNYWVNALADDYNREHRFKNSVADLAFDPINAVGGVGKIGKATKLTDKLAEAAKGTKFGSWIGRTTEKVAANKAIQWLGAEHKTPEMKLNDAIDEARKAQQGAQSILPRINALNKQIAAAGGKHFDTTGLTRLQELTDSEIPVFKRMVNGKLSAIDRARLAGKGMQPVREKLEGIAAAWQDFSEQMRIADNVQTSRFGLGKKNYIPDTTWIDRKADDPLSKYNFRKFKKGTGGRTADDVFQSAVDRYFKSSVDSHWSAGEMTKSARLKATRDSMLNRYDAAVEPQRAAVQKAYAKTQTPFNRFRRATRSVSPINLWKQSVLKFRPAWYANNEFYNTQAVGLAAGGRGLWEKTKMLNPRYFNKAMDEIPASVKTNIAKEIGNDPLAKGASRQENWSRVAAFRALKKKGLTDEQALKRVNRYLFDYTTKNWERPIKAVVPFWQFQKNAAKAAAVMPFDRPLAAKAYNQLDRYQQQQFNSDFDSVVPKLKELGYTDAEIEKMRADQSKYFAGKLKVGGRYWNTPFNAFSEKQMSQLGFNPYLAAAGETSDSVDSFGAKVGGTDASWWRRLASKFPQVDLGIQAKKALDVQAGRSKPHSSWIAQPGSEGYGLTKEKQSYDPSKPNYVKSGDPRAKLGQNALAFAGVPRSMEFDKSKLIKTKTLQKATGAYFSLDTKSMDYPTAEAARQAIFKKYGLTADDFYKGILSKYDTEQTKQIKSEKEAAAAANKSLFEEYGKQPKGTRNVWATQKLRTLLDQGYFDKNPFLKSFDWINPTTVAKADKSSAVAYAVKTGDWSKYQAKYGKTQKQKDYEFASKTGDWSKWQSKYGKSDKAKARDQAIASKDWTSYKAKYGTNQKQSPFQYAGKFFKTADSMNKYKEGEFWKKYALATSKEKKQLLAANPQYNTRADWTKTQWDAWKAEDRKKFLALGGFIKSQTDFKSTAVGTATRYLSGKGGKYKKVKWA